MMPIGRGGSTKATFSTKSEGARLVTMITRTIPASGRATSTTMRYREVRYLADDTTMVVEITRPRLPTLSAVVVCVVTAVARRRSRNVCCHTWEQLQ